MKPNLVGNQSRKETQQVQPGFGGFSEFVVDSINSAHGSAPSTHPAMEWERLSQQLQSIQRGLLNVIKDHQDGRSCLRQIAEVLDQSTQTLFLFWHNVENSELAETPADVVNKVEITSRIGAAVHQLASEAYASQQIRFAKITLQSGSANDPVNPAADPPNSNINQRIDGPVDRDANHSVATPGHIVSIPICIDSAIAGVLTACFFADVYSTHWLTALAETVASSIGLSLANQRDAELEHQLATTAAIIDLAVRVESTRNFEAAGRVLSDELARHIGCTSVVTGVIASKRCRILAISETDDAPNVERQRLIEAALDEIAIRDQIAIWPAQEATERHSLLTLKQLAEEESAECVIGTPIRGNGRKVVGCWLFLGDQSLANDESVFEFARACEHRIGPSLQLVKDAQRSKIGLAFKHYRERSGRSLSKTLFAALMLIAAILAIPMPYRVSCKTELQPVTRRFVAAPFEGTLQKAYVEPGDVVLKGQLLALIDDREIQIELKSIDADFHRASKERDTHLAERDIAAAQLSGFDMERLTQRKNLLEHRLQNLEIRSPFDGLVLAGDLKKSQGVPLDTGASMFEIAPLEDMLVEIAIPEDDVRHVTVGQIVEMRLDAFPNEKLTGTLQRVHPRGEIRDDRLVFVGEIELKNQHAQLLPGMQGTARVITESRTLAWTIFHKPYESFLMWMGW